MLKSTPALKSTPQLVVTVVHNIGCGGFRRLLFSKTNIIFGLAGLGVGSVMRHFLWRPWPELHRRIICPAAFLLRLRPRTVPHLGTLHHTKLHPTKFYRFLHHNMLGHKKSKEAEAQPNLFASVQTGGEM